MILDEVGTIERIATEGIWIPVLRPSLEPWLELELVIDEGISMQIWRHTIKELERLLKNYGIFRDVRVWGMSSEDGETVQIRQGIGSDAKNQFPRSPAELINPGGVVLVLVVSDCVSSVWRNGVVISALKIWSENGLVAIAQMLPLWLWKRTALGGVSQVRLRGLVPGVFNQQLIAQAVSLWDEIEEQGGIKVPVFTLEADKMGTWAQMVSGKGNVWTWGVIFRLDSKPINSDLLGFSQGELTAQKRVQGFRVTASPMARKLAGLLAAAPVITLPVVRLIQETLLKDSLQVNVAEVFLGGLLRPLSEINIGTNPDQVQYDFMDGVRELLVDSVPTNYVLNVVDEVSKYVAKKVGLSLEDFAAVLRNPQRVRDSEIGAEVGYFATVTAQVLRRLGGEYARLAEELESYEQVDLQKDIETDLDSLPDVEYQTGGSLPPDSSSYIKRKADDDLYNALKAGLMCFIYAPRQMGKSSLIIQIIKRLREEGFVCAIIDLSILGSRNTANDFYYYLAYRLCRFLDLKKDIREWWQDQELSSNLRFLEFVETVLLKEVNQPIIIFIDEVDSIFNYDFSLDFLDLLRSLYETRNYKKEYNPLNFVLLGVILHFSIQKNILTSPLNIGVYINLEGFTFEEALPLAGGLKKKTKNPQELLKAILYWTGGQPFLTQKLCELVQSAEDVIPEGNEKAWLDNLVRTKIIKNWEEQEELQVPHLQLIRNRIFYSEKLYQLLSLYMLILQESESIVNKEVEIQELMLTGLVIRKDGKLKVANRIYAEVFNQDWILMKIDRFLDGTVFVSVDDDYKRAIVPIVKDLINLGFRIVATFQTKRFLQHNNIEEIPVLLKLHEGSPHVIDWIKRNLIQLIINIASDEKSKADAQLIHQTALEYKVPVITSIIDAETTIETIRSVKFPFEVFFIADPRWTTWKNNDLIARKDSKNQTVSFSGKFKGAAGYVIKLPEGIPYAGKNLTLNIEGCKDCIFDQGKLFKLEANGQYLIPNLRERINLNDQQYINSGDGKVTFKLPDQLTKLEFVFWNATLNNLTISATVSKW